MGLGEGGDKTLVSTVDAGDGVEAAKVDIVIKNFV